MIIARWKSSINNKYFCSNCLMSTAIPSYTCDFCGAMMTNLESILNDLTRDKNYDIIKKIMERIEEEDE